KRAPKTNVQAQFSNPWVVATILNNGQITLEDFTPAALENKTILALTQKVNTALDDTMVTKGGGVGPTRVVVELKDGRQLTETALTAKGEPNQPLTPAEFEQKFKDCAASAGLNATQIASIIKDIEGLEHMTQASRLCEQLVKSA
ncbi:MAG: MmgE/PrpD family protein, partial [Pusillimonas sp.]